MKLLSLLLICLFFSPFAWSQDDSNQSQWTYDLGASLGSTSTTNYQELNLGLNYNFSSWLAWRNALFGRFSSAKEDGVTAEDTYGLDSSLRADFTTQLGESDSLTLFGGPGVRLDNDGNTEGFAEAGVNIRIGGLNVGGGVKSILTEDNNDTQFFLILNGTGQL